MWRSWLVDEWINEQRKERVRENICLEKASAKSQLFYLIETPKIENDPK